MLEEITGMFLSLFSLFVNATPRVSLREPIDPTSDTEEEGVDDDRWQPYINKEYENFHTNEQLNSDYTRLDGTWSQRSYWESIRRSLWTTVL
jgi:hypothetical protein